MRKTALALCSALLLTACGGADESTSRLDALSADEVFDEAREGLASAQTVRVRGSILMGEEEVLLDLQLEAGRGGAGTLTIMGFELELVRIEEDVWFRAPAAFYEAQGLGEAVALLDGKFALSSTNDAGFGEFGEFTDIEMLAEQFFPPDDTTFQKGDPTEVLGESVLPLTDADDADAGTLFVTTSDPVRPVQIAVLDDEAGQGTIDFVDYDVPFELVPPPADQVVDQAAIGG